MSTTVMSRARQADTPPLSRLVQVELRKLADTRASRWLLATSGLLLVAVPAMQFSDRSWQWTFQAFFAGTQLPAQLILPIVGILAMTSEWSQRTALTTFALVPQRHRVTAAKLGAVAATAVLTVAASLAVAAGLNLFAKGFGGAGTWNITAALLGHALLSQLVNVLLGAGLGLLLANTPLAIVAFFVAPQAAGIVARLLGSSGHPWQWLDIEASAGLLTRTDTLTAGQWAQIAVAVAVWVIIPLAAGTARTGRREIS